MIKLPNKLKTFIHLHDDVKENVTPKERKIMRSATPMSDSFSKNLSTEVLREKDISKLSPENRVSRMVHLAKEKTWSKKKEIPLLRTHDYD